MKQGSERKKKTNISITRLIWKREWFFKGQLSLQERAVLTRLEGVAVWKLNAPIAPEIDRSNVATATFSTNEPAGWSEAAYTMARWRDIEVEPAGNDSNKKRNKEQEGIKRGRRMGARRARWRDTFQGRGWWDSRVSRHPFLPFSESGFSRPWRPYCDGFCYLLPSPQMRQPGTHPW